MAKSNAKKVIFAIQIVLAVLVAVGLGWIAFKVIGYNQAQGIYHEMEKAYASETVDGDPNSIDWAALQEKYPNAVGWLKMDDVDISYPIMKGTDNDHYLYYAPDDSQSIVGSIFMDYRNKSFDDLHVLIYGHNMLDESMFGRLDEYVSEQFYNNGTASFTIFTPKAAYRYQIFAANIVDATDAIYQSGYQNQLVFGAFVKQLKERSMYETDVDVSGLDHVVTLSTCSANDRLVLSAKRLKG